MDLKIRTVVISYDQNGVIENVNIGFDSYEADASLNGNVKLTEEEYNTNSADLTSLSALVVTKVKANVNA